MGVLVLCAGEPIKRLPATKATTLEPLSELGSDRIKLEARRGAYIRHVLFTHYGL